MSSEGGKSSGSGSGSSSEGSVEGKAIAAAGLPEHLYVMERGSSSDEDFAREVINVAVKLTKIRRHSFFHQTMGRIFHSCDCQIGKLPVVKLLHEIIIEKESIPFSVFFFRTSYEHLKKYEVLNDLVTSARKETRTAADIRFLDGVDLFSIGMLQKSTAERDRVDKSIFSQ